MAGAQLRQIAPGRSGPARGSGTEPRAPRLGEILVAQGALSGHELQMALRTRRGARIRIGDYLLRQGLITPEQLLAALGEQYGLTPVALQAEPPDPAVLASVDVAVCLRLRAVPWRRTVNALVVATDDPSNPERLAALARPGERVELVLVASDDLHAALVRFHADALVHHAETLRPAPFSFRSVGARVPVRLEALALIAAVAFLVMPALFGAVLLAAATLSVVAVTALRLCAVSGWAKARWRRRASAGARRDFALPTFTLLVPLLREAHMVPSLATALRKIDYPSALVEVIFLTEADDLETQAALRDVADGLRWRLAVLPEGTIRTKPRALNYGMALSSGEIIGVYDAEDHPHPGQLREVAATFADRPEIGCVQCALDYHNYAYNWTARAFTIEYNTHFRLLLPGLTALRLPVPLGGTSNFVRRAAVEQVGGWDAHNVTEDADLGFRLGRAGFVTLAIGLPTSEEANCHPPAWIRQRTRWLKGYLVTWIVQAGLRAEDRLRPGGRLVAHAMLLATVCSFLLAPVLWSLWPATLGLPHPLLAPLGEAGRRLLLTLFVGSTVLRLGVDMLALAIAGKARLIPWLPVMAIYWPMATVAAWRAVSELALRPYHWEKTEHGITPPPTPAVPATEAPPFRHQA